MQNCSNIKELQISKLVYVNNDFMINDINYPNYNSLIFLDLS